MIMVTVQVADLSHKNFKSSRVMRWWLSRLSSRFGAKSSHERKLKWLPGLAMCREGISAGHVCDGVGSRHSSQAGSDSRREKDEKLTLHMTPNSFISTSLVKPPTLVCEHGKPPLVSTSKYNSDRQPQISICLPKMEIITCGTLSYSDEIPTHCYFRLSVNVVFICGHFLGVVEDFVYRARITVILILQIYSAVWVCDYNYVL